MYYFQERKKKDERKIEENYTILKVNIWIEGGMPWYDQQVNTQIFSFNLLFGPLELHLQIWVQSSL